MYLCRESILGCSHLPPPLPLPRLCPSLCPFIAVALGGNCNKLKRILVLEFELQLKLVSLGRGWDAASATPPPSLPYLPPRWGLIARCLPSPPLVSHICAFICACVRCVLLIIVDGVDLMQKAANSVDAGSDAGSGQRSTRLLDLACH